MFHAGWSEGQGGGRGSFQLFKMGKRRGGGVQSRNFLFVVYPFILNIKPKALCKSQEKIQCTTHTCFTFFI